ncbi:MAG: DUF4837 family protein, partial [Flavobacteriaceae bacterium]|nr:DUF4837 family protein [Flavobacteriaceae bacterium]
FLVFLNSCNNPPSNYKPGSSGNINTVTIIINNDLWNSAVGSTIRNAFASEFVGLPQIEPIFNLKQMPFEAFSGFSRESRNIILIQKTDKDNVIIQTDKYAQPQFLVAITGRNQTEIIQSVEKNKRRIISLIKTNEIREKQRRMKISKLEKNELKEFLSLDLIIPSAYKVFKKGVENIIWFQRETNKGTVNVLAYALDEKNFYKGNSLSELIKLRDSVGKSFVPGRNKNSYMITEEAYEPYIKKTRVGGLNAFETRGTWELKNDFMAGPFINYLIKDTVNRRTIALEGFVFSPSSRKRELIFELESIFKSLRIYKKQEGN